MTYGWCFQDILNKVTVAEMITHYVYQQKNPPLHQLVAHYLGIHDKKNDVVSKSDSNSKIKRASALQRAKESQLGHKPPTPPGMDFGEATDGKSKYTSLKKLRESEEEKKNNNE